MIYDAENTFMWQKDVSSVGTSGVDSDVVFCGKGDAQSPVWLTVTVSEPLTDAATVVVETAEKDTMAAKQTLATFTMAKGEQALKAKLPQGSLGYTRIHVAATSGNLKGKMTAALVLDA